VKFALEQARWPDGLRFAHRCEGKGVRAHHWQAPQALSVPELVVNQPPSNGRYHLGGNKVTSDHLVPCFYLVAKQDRNLLTSL